MLTLAVVSALAGDVVGAPAAPSRPLERLAIYYGYPSLVEKSGGDIVKAAAVFATYDVVVWGDGLELGRDSADAGLRGEYARLAPLVARLHTGTTRVALYGYIDLGRTQQLTMDEIITRVEAWQRLGVDGIFFDEAGRDFGVTPARRGEAVRAVHARRLAAFMNAFNPDDLFDRGSSPGSGHELGRGDAILLESFAVRQGRLQTEAVPGRIAAALEWRKRRGVSVFATTTAGDEPFDRAAFASAWHRAATLRLDGFGWGERNFGADTQLPWRPRPEAERTKRSTR
jgi:hypothetical protein